MESANIGQRVQIEIEGNAVQGIVKRTQIINMPDGTLPDYQRIYIDCLSNPDRYVNIEAAAWQFDYC